MEPGTRREFASGKGFGKGSLAPAGGACYDRAPYGGPSDENTQMVAGIDICPGSKFGRRPSHEHSKRRDCAAHDDLASDRRGRVGRAFSTGGLPLAHLIESGARQGERVAVAGAVLGRTFLDVDFANDLDQRIVPVGQRAERVGVSGERDQGEQVVLAVSNELLDDSLGGLQS